jgi:C4-dicarboxylate transporter DctM subunit
VIIAGMIALRDRLGLIRTTRRTTDWSEGVGVARRIVQGVLAIGLPVLLLVGIESGVLTATESSAVAVIYAVLATLVSTPRVGIRQLWRVIQTAASMAGLLLFLIAISSTIGTAAALAQVPQHIAESLANVGSSKLPFLLLTIIIVPIAGALLEGLPAVLIFAPLFVPTAELLGINIIHYGIVFVIALGIGAFSPLLGVGFYTACKVTGADVTAATRRYWVYFACLMAGLILVAFVPQITLAVPKLLGYAGV